MSNVRAARIGFALLAWLFVALAIFQVFLAGTALQVLGGGGDNFSTHQALGFVIMIIALIQLVLSFAARLGWRMIGASAVLLVLMILQSALVHLNSASLAALHPLNGFLVGVLGIWIAWRGLSFIRAPLPVEPLAAVPASQMTPAVAPAGAAQPAPVEKPVNEGDN